jgi:carbohydrate-binding DOMON domain-containing protein
VPAEALPEGSTIPTGFDGSRIELAVPLESLGALDVGDPVRFRLVDRSGGEDGPMAPADGPGAMQVPDISDVAVALEVTDPTGDDHGPGAYTYPTDPVFGAGAYDLTAFSVGESGDDLVFSFEVATTIQNPWDSPIGLSVQTFDVYVDTDPGAATGARLFLPGRNASWVEGGGWERALTIEGWQSALYEAAPDGTNEVTQPTFKVLVFPDKGRVVARLPRALFPNGDLGSWEYAVALLSQEGFPSSGVRRVRDVESTASQYRLGGGSAAINDTRIIDLAWPDPGVQEAMLSDFSPTDTGSTDDLTPDDFAQVSPLP